MIVLGGVIITFIALCVGIPIFASLAVASILLMVYHYHQPISNVAHVAFGAVNNFALLAMPLFIIAGNLAVAGGAAKRIINFCNAFLGQVRGGLLVSVIVFCTLFAACSGSGLAGIAAVGTIMYPELRKDGYSPALSAGAIASSGELGILIPPSLFFILIGMLMRVSAVSLFFAGLIPGLIMSLFLCTIALFLARREGVVARPTTAWKERVTVSIKSAPALLLAVIILGGIYSGFFTPTEAATVACVYAVFLGFVVYRELTWSKLVKTLSNAGLTTGAIYILIATVTVFTHIISLSGFPQMLAKMIIESGMSAVMFVIILNAAVLVLTFFIDPWALMFMIIPILMPVFTALDVNLVWMGVTMCICTMIGYMTPPMAVGLYFTARLLDLPAAQVIKGIIPFLVAQALVIPVVIFFPEVALWFPRLLGFPV